jgi:hypothetical protein
LLQLPFNALPPSASLLFFSAPISANDYIVVRISDLTYHHFHHVYPPFTHFNILVAIALDQRQDG